MHWQQVLGAGVRPHLSGLLWAAVRVDPGIVRTDWHDRQVHRPRTARRTELIGVRCVAAEHNAVTAGLEQVAVVAPMSVGADPDAPLPRLQAYNGRPTHA